MKSSYNFLEINEVAPEKKKKIEKNCTSFKSHMQIDFIWLKDK